MELPLPFGLITGEFFHLRICLGVEKIFGPKIVLHCSRPCDLEYLGIFLFCYILNIYVYKMTVCGECWGKKIWEPPIFEIWRKIRYLSVFFYRIFKKFPDISYQARPPMMQNLSKHFFLKKHKMVFVGTSFVCLVLVSRTTRRATSTSLRLGLGFEFWGGHSGPAHSG